MSLIDASDRFNKPKIDEWTFEVTDQLIEEVIEESRETADNYEDGYNMVLSDTIKILEAYQPTSDHDVSASDFYGLYDSLAALNDKMIRTRDKLRPKSSQI